MAKFSAIENIENILINILENGYKNALILFINLLGLSIIIFMRNTRKFVILKNLMLSNPRSFVIGTERHESQRIDNPAVQVDKVIQIVRAL